MNISVIITTRDRPQQLKEACQSVFKQTVKPQEIIIVDDGSKITVEQLGLEELCLQDITIKIERFDSSQGACVARNRGAEIAKNDILMFLDDDDTWEENKIKDQLLVFTQNEEIGLVYSGRLMVREKYRKKVLYKVKATARGNIYPDILYKNLIGSTSSVAIKKSLFNMVKGFDPDMPAFQDYDLWIRCCQKTVVEHDNSYNVRYTISTKPTAQISGQAHRHIEAASKILNKYSQEITAQGDFQARKIRSARFFAVAKSLRHHRLNKALPWIFSSFWQYPNLKSLALIIPLKSTQWLRVLRQKYLK